jgi:hypothetical protein
MIRVAPCQGGGAPGKGRFEVDKPLPTGRGKGLPTLPSGGGRLRGLIGRTPVRVLPVREGARR